MRRARIAVAVLLALSAAPGSSAVAQEPANTKKSDRVSHLGFLAEPQVISARFKGSLMYVSTLRGLSIYDVSDARAPRRLGALNLPHFENEDIDVGNGIALISNDPSEGVGRLHVIDVRDPAAPRLLSSLDTGSADAGILTGALGGPFGIGTGTGHTASCLQDCRFAYLAGSLRGIDVVDLRDPAKPKYATPANFPVPEATGGLSTHDIQFDSEGRAWITGAGGTAAYDVTNPLNPVLVARSDAAGDSRYPKTFGNDDGSTYNDFIHHNSMRISNASLAALPPGIGRTADSRVVAVTEEDYNRPTCRGAGSFETWELRPGAVRGAGADEKGPPVQALKPLDKWDVEVDPSRQSLCSAHYFDDRGGLVAQGWYEQGVRFLDISDPSDIRQVGYWIPQKNLMWGALYPPTDPTGEVVYALDHVRGIDVIRFDRPDPVIPGTPQVPDPSRNNELPTVVAPPADGPGVARADVPGRARSGRRPDVAVSVSDGRSRVRAGQRLRWRVDVRHVAGEAAEDVVVRLDLPRVVGRRRVTRRLGRLAPGQRRTVSVSARVARRPRARAVLVSVSVAARDDANPRDNRARDRTPLRRRARIAALAGTPSSEARLKYRGQAPILHERTVPVPVLSRAPYAFLCRL